MIRLVLGLMVAALAGTARAEIAPDLAVAIREQDAASIHRVLSDHPDWVAATDARGATPLMVAAFRREKGDFVGIDHNVAFQAIAAHVNRPTVIEAVLLRDRKRVAAALRRDPALIGLQAKTGWTLLHFAAFAGAREIAADLLDRGARLDARAMPSFGVTPTQSALIAHRSDMADYLLSRGADPWVRFSDGTSLLHEAALLGDVDMIAMLARRGSNPKALRDNGATPRDLALKRGFVEAAAALERLEQAGEAATSGGAPARRN